LDFLFVKQINIEEKKVGKIAFVLNHGFKIYKAFDNFSISLLS